MYKRIILLVLLLICLFASAVYAEDLRVIRLRKFLSRYPTSPLIKQAEYIVQCSDLFGLDYRLFVAIAGAESGFGRKTPKNSQNLTGICNGDTVFNSIRHNIYYTHKLIGTNKWYKKYRKTNDIKDLVYVYKGVPPYDHYIRNMRFALDKISSLPLEEEKIAYIKDKTKDNLLVSWNAHAYHNAEANNRVDMHGKENQSAELVWSSARYDQFDSNSASTIDFELAEIDLLSENFTYA